MHFDHRMIKRKDERLVQWQCQKNLFVYLAIHCSCAANARRLISTHGALPQRSWAKLDNRFVLSMHIDALVFILLPRPISFIYSFFSEKDKIEPKRNTRKVRRDR